MQFRTSIGTIAALALVVAAAGCAAGTSFDADDRAAVQATWDAMAAADTAADFEALAVYLTDDHVHLDPRVPTIRGLDEFRAWVASMEFGGEEATYTVEEIDGSGDVAWVVWTYRGSWMQGGQQQEADAKGLSVFVREADGSWKAARNAWNRTPTPLEGVWRTVEASGTNDDGEWRAENVQPSLYIFRGRHYSIMYVQEDEPRALLGEEATRDSISNAQVRAVFKPFVANSGTYTIDGSTLTTVPDVALWPDFMEGGTATFTFSVEGNSLTLHGENDGVITDFRLQRIE